MIHQIQTHSDSPSCFNDSKSTVKNKVRVALRWWRSNCNRNLIISVRLMTQIFEGRRCYQHLTQCDAWDCVNCVCINSETAVPPWPSSSFWHQTLPASAWGRWSAVLGSWTVQISGPSSDPDEKKHQREKTIQLEDKENNIFDDIFDDIFDEMIDDFHHRLSPFPVRT